MGALSRQRVGSKRVVRRVGDGGSDECAHEEEEDKEHARHSGRFQDQ